MRLAMGRFLLASCVMLAAGAVQAVPVNYTFSGFSVGEYSGAGAPVAGNTIYAGPTQVSGSFVYDDAIAQSGLVPVAGYNNALFTAYRGAFSDLDITVAGSAVTADIGTGLVGNNVTTTAGALTVDAVLGAAGLQDPASSFSGFGVGNWQLVGLSFVFLNSPASFIDSDLPAVLGTGSNLMEFFFANSLGQSQKVRYAINSMQQVVSVPEPSTALLLGLGIAGLWLRRTTRKQ